MEDHPHESTDQELLDTLRLSLISGVGPRTRIALIERFGTAGAALAAAPAELRKIKGVGPKLLEKILKADHEVDTQAVIELCRQKDVDILTESDQEYPRALREIHDPPGVLFVRGSLKTQDALSISIVG